MDNTLLSQLATNADHPSSYLSQNEQTEIFSTPKVEGFIAYRNSGRRYCVMVAGIISKSETRKTLLLEFIEFCRVNKRKIIAVQLLEEDAKTFGEVGFTVNQLGSSYGITLQDFTFKGTKFIRLRNKISRSKRSDIEVKELGIDLPITNSIKKDIDNIDKHWLKDKGKKELDFLIGELGDIQTLDTENKRVFVALRDGNAVGYILYSRCVGKYSGWMHDLSRKLPNAPAGCMEHINADALLKFQSEDTPFLHFGFTPLTGLRDDLEFDEYSSNRAAWVLRKIFEKGEFIYPAASQVQYKMKWKPDLIFPEYIAFQNGFSLRGLWNLLRITRAI